MIQVLTKTINDLKRDSKNSQKEGSIMMEKLSISQIEFNQLKKANSEALLLNKDSYSKVYLVMTLFLLSFILLKL